MLESRSTRRGVRICPTCKNRVGYRSKICKHCLVNAGGHNRTKCVRKNSRTKYMQELSTFDKNTDSKIIVGNDNFENSVGDSKRLGSNSNTFALKKTSFLTCDRLFTSKNNNIDENKVDKKNVAFESSNPVKNTVNNVLDEALAEEYLPPIPFDGSGVDNINELKPSTDDVILAKENAIQVSCVSLNIPQNNLSDDLFATSHDDVINREGMVNLQHYNDVSQSKSQITTQGDDYNVFEKHSLSVVGLNHDKIGFSLTQRQNIGGIDASETVRNVFTKSIIETAACLTRPFGKDESNVLGEADENEKTRIQFSNCHGRKKANVFLIQFLRIEPKPYSDISPSSHKDNEQSKIKENK